MKIWFISDTHGKHDQLRVPEADCVVHCGDESNSKNAAKNWGESHRFFEWYSDLPIKHKLFTPGNHSTAIFNGLINEGDYPVHFCINSGIEIEGLRFWGSPYTPSFNNWAYNIKRSKMCFVWNSMESCDVLFTHGPPKGILDLTDDMNGNGLAQAGCNSLYRKVKEIRPRIHAFGHIHRENDRHNYGILNDGETTFINCSCIGNHDSEIRNGFVLEVL